VGSAWTSDSMAGFDIQVENPTPASPLPETLHLSQLGPITPLRDAFSTSISNPSFEPRDVAHCPLPLDGPSLGYRSPSRIGAPPIFLPSPTSSPKRGLAVPPSRMSSAGESLAPDDKCRCTLMPPIGAERQLATPTTTAFTLEPAEGSFGLPSSNLHLHSTTPSPRVGQSPRVAVDGATSGTLHDAPKMLLGHYDLEILPRNQHLAPVPPIPGIRPGPSPRGGDDIGMPAFADDRLDAVHFPRPPKSGLPPRRNSMSISRPSSGSEDTKRIPSHSKGKKKATLSWETRNKPLPALPRPAPPFSRPAFLDDPVRLSENSRTWVVSREVQNDWTDTVLCDAWLVSETRERIFRTR